MREFLTNLIADLKKRYKATETKLDAAETKEEIRSLGATLKELRDDINAAEEQLKKLDEEGGEGEGQASQNPQEGRSANPLRDFRQVGQYGQQSRQAADNTDSVEYRTAFMNFVCRNVPIPMELRSQLGDEATTTAMAGAAIPTTVMNEIIRELGVYGEIYAKVRKLNVQGGVKIPVSTIKPVATWITADAAASESRKQPLATAAIVFNYYGLECKVSQTLLVNVTTLEAFQELFVKLAAEAMVQAMEHAIFNGTGEGMPLGILNDERVENVVDMTEEEFTAWTMWAKMVFAKMKKAYRNGCFIMAQGTFDGYINGMVDQLGQPIGRVNFGITDGETYRFGGKEVLTVEEDILPSWDNAEEGEPVAVFMRLSDYAINSNLQMQAVKWVDHDTNEIKNKCILICDGKLIDPCGVLIIRKAGVGASE